MKTVTDPATGEVRERMDDQGREIPDPMPMEMPVGFQRPESLESMVRRLVRTQVSQEAAEQGFETFEEASDFEIEDDPLDPSTPFEEVFDPVLGVAVTPAEFKANAEHYEKMYKEYGNRVTRGDLVAGLLNAGVDPDTLAEIERRIDQPGEPLKPAPKVASEPDSGNAADAEGK